MENLKNYEAMSIQEKWNILATVANLYYNSELTQNQIAERLYTSRSKISRMLKEARELGIVEIYIREPWERDLEYEQKIQEQFHLKSIRIIKQKDTDKEKAKNLIYEAAAYYLDSIIKENMVIGISWGNTLYHVIKYIAANNHKNIPVTVVPIMGAANINSPEKDGLDLSKDLASAYGGKYQYIYAPLFVKNREIKESLIQDDNIKGPLNLAKNADVILTSVGSVVYKSWHNYLSSKVFDALEEKGVVGHIGGHFFNIYGQELDSALTERMIGIDMDDFKKCRETICIALGEKKAEAVLGAIRGNYISALIIDDKCAKKILEISEK
ncbi:MAG: sugar-binding transcriptional regulator [Oscillospiraceae bacterium]|nr:sugar-binding transcriptional regulator [Oscillospiraceae bacterium]MCI9669006.1 sugar-binding transcriptional regulator [Oscillospiraceae bacterium]RKJ53925.1 sugar-binding transcriptional regulator [bacterium 1XD42-8]RKJ63204.1 sugar-binding transcriptional regulator [bacterium 1XD42-1]